MLAKMGQPTRLAPKRVAGFAQMRRVVPEGSFPSLALDVFRGSLRHRQCPNWQAAAQALSRRALPELVVLCQPTDFELQVVQVQVAQVQLFASAIVRRASSQSLP